MALLESHTTKPQVPGGPALGKGALPGWTWSSSTGARYRIEKRFLDGVLPAPQRRKYRPVAEAPPLTGRPGTSLSPGGGLPRLRMLHVLWVPRGRCSWARWKGMLSPP